jgi:hypothetical protein
MTTLEGWFDEGKKRKAAKYMMTCCDSIGNWYPSYFNSYKEGVTCHEKASSVRECFNLRGSLKGQLGGKVWHFPEIGRPAKAGKVTHKPIKSHRKLKRYHDVKGGLFNYPDPKPWKPVLFSVMTALTQRQFLATAVDEEMEDAILAQGRCVKSVNRDVWDIQYLEIGSDDMSNYSGIRLLMVLGS